MDAGVDLFAVNDRCQTKQEMPALGCLVITAAILILGAVMKVAEMLQHLLKYRKNP